ncbi:MAG TPA: tannase/feruloyl esterase family alpha/beta hydrolase [Candidatus Koribacter sp.]
MKVLSLFFCTILLSNISAAQNSCDALAKADISNTTITMAQSVAAGTFNGPPDLFTGRDISAFYKTLPAFCRVIAAAKPTTDSDIKIEVWLPVSGWNGRLQGLGNGGFAGLIDTRGLGASLLAGYVATATDTGHTGSPVDATWALGHPEKVADFGHRGIHEMTRVAKAVIEAYYGKAQQHSYFEGCSDGGREALMEAQRYPDDYDGILAGAPANNWTGLLSEGAYDTQALTANPASFIPPAKIPTIAAAVNEACDAADGLKDGVLNDPRRCHFDPAKIQCKPGEDNDKCLTAAQVSSLKKIYAGLHDSKGREVHAGYLPGAENGDGGWGLWIIGPAPAKSLMAIFAYGFFANMVYENPKWTAQDFNLDSSVKAAEGKTAAMLNANDPDLKPFAAHGGKLVLYHGWDDPAIPSVNTVEYYDHVLSANSQADSLVRLYMIPGMQHCDGGPGAHTWGTAPGPGPTDPRHNAMSALTQWVEKGVAPGRMIATRYSDDEQTKSEMTRPLCPYPQSAKYNGGDANNEASFDCVKQK